MKEHKLKVEKRKVMGRKVKALRAEGVLPANIYGKNIKSQAVAVKTDDFLSVFKDAGQTSVVEISLGKQLIPTLIHNIQYDPVEDSPVHVDFLKVDLKQKVVAAVPIEVQGESPAEKAGLGTAVQQVDELEVEALPTDLPEKFVVDISQLKEVDQAIFVKDLDYDQKKIEIKLDPEQILVKVEPLQKEEEVAPPAKEEGVEGAEEPEGVEEVKEGEKPEEAGEEGKAEKAEKPEAKAETENKEGPGAKKG